MAKIEIEPVKEHIGAIVRVERASLCDDDVVQQCKTALEEWGVLIFPRIGVTDSEQLAFTDRLGPRVNYNKGVPGGDVAKEDVYTVTLDPEINDLPEYVQGTFFWHIDGITMNMPLPKATILTARKLAPRGGLTEFANLYAAYEHLPEDEKTELEGMRAVHTMVANMRPIIEVPTAEDLARWSRASDMEHPIVWTHASGRKSLVVGTHADDVIGMPRPDARALLVRLMEWAAQPNFRYTHHWQEGDMVIWDNCGVMHRVTPYDKLSGRSMHRTTISGDETVN